MPSDLHMVNCTNLVAQYPLLECQQFSNVYTRRHMHFCSKSVEDSTRIFRQGDQEQLGVNLRLPAEIPTSNPDLRQYRFIHHLLGSEFYWR